MPKYWYTRQKNPYNDEKIEFENRIAATLKPYFMIYIYPQLRDEYNNYIKKTNLKCIRLFGMDYAKLLDKKRKNKTERDFIENVNKYLPVTDKQSVMNRLCHIVENAFNGYVTSLKTNSNFNPDIFKSGNAYSASNYKAISGLYSQYQQDIQRFVIQNQVEHTKQEDVSIQYQCLYKEYKRLCIETCPDETELCDILIDLCYNTEKSKQFVWEMCGDSIIENLLKKHDNIITYIERDNDGDIEYGGYRFSKREKRIGE